MHIPARGVSIFTFSLVLLQVAAAQDVSVLANGLTNPIRLMLTPAGNLLVSENGKDNNSGRIELVTRAGNRRVIVDGLPSGLSAPNLTPDGVTGLVVKDRTLYIEIGEGDALRSGPKPGTSVPNPAGIASPILSSILRLQLNEDIDNVTGPFTLKPADHWTLADGNSVTLTSAANETATLDVLADFRDTIPDPVTIYRNTHPFSLAMLPDQPGTLYVGDAGQNAIITVDTATGRIHTAIHFPPVKSVVPGPPVSDAVPDNIRVWNGKLLVTELTGFPFTPGQSRVVLFDPATNTASPFINGLASTIDIAVRPVADGRPQFWVLEFSANQSKNPPPPGRLLRFDTPDGQVVLDNLVTPTSMVLDNQTGDLFISELATGNIKQVHLTK